MIEAYGGGNGFAERLANLKKDGFEVASLRDYAEYIEKDEDLQRNFLKSPGGFTKEGIFYVPEKGIVLVRESPLCDLNNANSLMELIEKNRKVYRELRKKACSEGNVGDLSRLNMEEGAFPFYVDATKYLAQAEEDQNSPIGERRALLVDPNIYQGEGIFRIPKEELEKNEIFRWAFQDYTERHAKTLKTLLDKENPFFVGCLPPSSTYKNFQDIRQFNYSPAEGGEFGCRGNKKYSTGSILAKKLEK